MASKSTTPEPTGGFVPSNPLILQSDRSLLLEVHNPRFEAARAAISPFAELEKSPEHIHTYRISALSLWNAASTGLTAPGVVEALGEFAKFPLPSNVVADIQDLMGRWGRLRLIKIGKGMCLDADDPALLLEIARHKSVQPFWGKQISPRRVSIPLEFRGVIKQTLIGIGWPVEDIAGYSPGESLDLELKLDRFEIRDYQRDAAESFYLSGTERGGSGVIVLPCGAGKTIVGLAVMGRVKQSTLILTTSRTSVHQWQREIQDKTTIPESDVVEYLGDSRRLGPVTLATYQMLTHRPDRTEEFPNLKLFNAREWGLIIYDEVHTLPAPIFRVTAEVQARRRLGLTATLIREDGRETDVFTLIGPKRYDAPWRDLEQRGWIAQAVCVEVRCPVPRETRMAYATAENKARFRIASENPVKVGVTERILKNHPEAPSIVIGQYIEQLETISRKLGAPLMTGKTTQRERERLFEAFRRGEIPVLVLSKVGNFAIDLPDAEVLVQVSGTFGSRQEEAQRLGRILRPKADGRTAHFYTLVSHETEEEEFAHHRQLFLAEQGYTYTILDEEEV